MIVKPDPADELPALEAGEWVDEKHRLLRHYVDISHAARRGWTDPDEARRRGIQGPPAGATFIELFAGPGRVFIRGTDRFQDGSPLVAYDEAAKTGTAFTCMHLGDEQPDFCEAVRARLEQRHAKVVTYPMPAVEAAKHVVQALNPYGLNFAFLDPFGFEGLPFSIIETFARFKRMDVLIYVSAMGLQRQVEKWSQSPKRCALDDFAPDWRKVIEGRGSADIVTRGLIFEHWLSLIRKVGFKEAKGRRLIRGPQRQPLYWLVLVAKHELARKFWDAVSRDESGQEDFFTS